MRGRRIAALCVVLLTGGACRAEEAKPRCTTVALEYENRSAKAVTVRASYRVTSEASTRDVAILAGEQLAPKEKRRVQLSECVAPTDALRHSVTVEGPSVKGPQPSASGFTGQPGASIVCRAVVVDAAAGVTVNHECRKE